MIRCSGGMTVEHAMFTAGILDMRIFCDQGLFVDDDTPPGGGKHLPLAATAIGISEHPSNYVQ